MSLARAGADLVLGARTMSDLQRTAREARVHGVRAEAVSMDAYDFEQVNGAVDAVTDRFGKIDILVNNAGGSRNVEGGWLGFLESTPRAVRELFELNVFSPYFAAQRAARAMERQGSGCIINISSPLADYPSARIQPYSVAKIAIQEFTRLWAFELGSKGIRVNAIAPGPIQSAQIEKVIAANPEREQAMIDEVPLGRIGQPADVGAAVVFLASDEAGWISGATLLISGGKRW
jgi:NAD(P)-dependent dehydrogenase (short-subunit alcohol dehydrogenase family)